MPNFDLTNKEIDKILSNENGLFIGFLHTDKEFAENLSINLPQTLHVLKSQTKVIFAEIRADIWKKNLALLQNISLLHGLMLNSFSFDEFCTLLKDQPVNFEFIALLYTLHFSGITIIPVDPVPGNFEEEKQRIYYESILHGQIESTPQQQTDAMNFRMAQNTQMAELITQKLGGMPAEQKYIMLGGPMHVGISTHLKIKSINVFSQDDLSFICSHVTDPQKTVLALATSSYSYNQVEAVALTQSLQVQEQLPPNIEAITPRYINICQNSVGRIMNGITPLEYTGLYTTGIETCFVIIIIGEQGISLIHNSGKLAEADIDKEFQHVGPVISWTLAYNPTSPYYQPGELGSIVTDIPDKFKKHGNATRQKIEQGFVSVHKNGAIETTNPPSSAAIFTDIFFDIRQKINTVNDFFTDPASKLPAELQFDGKRFSDLPKLKVDQKKAELFRMLLGDTPALNHIFSLKQEIENFLRDKDAANMLKEKGNGSFKRGNYEQAISYFEQAIEKFPNFKEASLNKAKALFKLNRFELALAAAEEARGIDPSWDAASNVIKEILKYASSFVQVAKKSGSPLYSDVSSSSSSPTIVQDPFSGFTSTGY